MEKKITFTAGNETLAGVINSNADELPHVLFLHGAGTATKERVNYLAPLFTKRDMSFMTFDFSGHGESTGKLNESSLQKRINETHEAMKLLDPDKKLTIIGSSMGGHIALEMMKTGRVETLILFCPAVYSDESVGIQFDQGFTDAIRKSDSRNESSLFAELEKYYGRIFIIIGDEDTVIPDGVIGKMIASTPKVKEKNLIYIPGAPHAIHGWLEAHPDSLGLIDSKIFASLD